MQSSILPSLVITGIILLVATLPVILHEIMLTFSVSETPISEIFKCFTMSTPLQLDDW
jgi:hypothetical protein